MEPIFHQGEILGRIYEIRGILGSGAMGQVFEAQDHSIDRRVAIKAAWPDLAMPPLRAEARALAAVRHVSLPTVYSLGVHRNIDYIVMERLYGVTLEKNLEQRLAASEPFSIDEVVGFIRAIAEGLAVVHRAGVVHRDVKPANVMLTPDRRVVLMDFGLFVPEVEVDLQSGPAGSPVYMAPEAITNTLERGQGHLIDIYALGVTAYELLTGLAPREADSLRQLHKMHQEIPTPDVRKARRDVPDPLADLISDMLASTPAERPPSVETILWRLASLKEHDKSEGASTKLRMLIVEDDPDIARVLGLYTKRALPDALIDVAKDGEAALDRLRKTTPDVMLLDVHLPRLNGVEVLMHMRGEGLASGCKVIVVSAAVEEQDRALLRVLGIHDILSKSEKLGDRLTAVLTGREVSGRKSGRR